MKDIWLSPTTVITVCDLPNQQVTVQGRVWRFDYDRHFGPLWLRKDGTERSCQNPKKEVWTAFELWLKKYNRKNKTKKPSNLVKIDECTRT